MTVLDSTSDVKNLIFEFSCLSLENLAVFPLRIDYEHTEI